MQYDQFFAGEYQIEKTLERSQYSVLCLGKMPATGRRVLLKLWLTAQVQSREERARIREEVSHLQHLEHPHLLSVLDVRADAQKVFLVSEYAPAGSLNERLGREGERALTIDEALHIVGQVGQALQELHTHGIIHGNLTPQAVFFSEPGQVKLGEFLIRSVLVNIQDYQHMLDENPPRCLYMAPEQFHGTLSPLTDQYALACLAYVLLTGRVPFAGSARSTLLQKHQRDEPPDLSAVNPAVPDYVEAAVLKALAKDPAERHRDIQTFMDALDVSGERKLADQNTIKQPVPLILADDTTVGDGIWEWEVTVRPDGQMVDSGPTRAIGASLQGPLVVQFPAGNPQVAQLSRPTRRRELYVVVPSVLLVLALLFVTSRWLFFAGASGIAPSRGQTVQGTQAPMLLTPATEATASGTVSSMQIPTPTPSPTPVAHPTGPQPSPTSGAQPTATPPSTATPKPVLQTLCKVVYKTSSQWPGSFLATLTITNTGSTPFTGWHLVFNFSGNQRLLNISRNTSASQNGRTVTLSGLNTSATLAPGASLSPSFLGSLNGSSNVAPTTFVLNGVACS